MATQATSPKAAQSNKLWGYVPQAMDYILSAACLAMLGAMALAIWRGQDQLAQLPLTYPLHFGTLAIALALTPVLLLRAKGDKAHRVMGYVWIAAMVITAVDTFFIRDINDGNFSLIHLLSVLTLFVCWRIVSSARAGDHVAHRGHVRGIVIGALLVAGFFTFMFNRLFAIWIAM
ncbi:DUF2306 domain-containing protein [Paraurantiacibacter namhicola]|uniref:DUF2306 domain-containing protein n=1 Tax=Paraurantiacibacter namhicola TaxID=645517 RepID=A0A1C7D688_9SPHN|nr:hypothetical protein [Paraurantiacibacter namhicola]ANU06975.1 hypothetical protein A6F65_00653 [Paraurantiacibacter namhicola]